MRDQMKDVRTLIVGMMESLGDKSDLKGNARGTEEMITLIQRGEVMAKLSREYVESVKTEVLAIRQADLHGYIPACMETPKSMLPIDHQGSGNPKPEIFPDHPKRIGSGR